MKEWLTAQEIAGEHLPELPCTRWGIAEFAAREGWNDGLQCRRREASGGGVEYNIRLLPTLAQVAYRQRYIAIGADGPPAPNNNEMLSDRAALQRDARLEILRAYELFARGQRLNQQGCEALFVSKFRAGTLAVESWVIDALYPPKKKDAEKKTILSTRTLARWRAAAAGDRDRLGIDRGAARKGKGALETANGGAVRTFILGLIAHQPHLSADHVREQCRAEFGDTIKLEGPKGERAIAMPPLRTFQAALKVLKQDNRVVLTKLTNPDLFRSTMKLAGSGSLRHVKEPNALWQIDASPVDALCTDGRYSVYVCVDIATRRAQLYLSKTARAAAVGLLLRKAVLAWGVPAEIKTDNGSDFTAKSTQRLFASLGIEMTLSQAFSPEQKGFVERLIGTFQRDAVALLPGFVGHSVADRKAIESRKAFAQRLGEDDAKTFAVQCSAAEMQAYFDAWSDVHYQHTPHEGLGRRSPFAVAAAAAHTIRRVDVRALDLLLAPTADGNGTRTVTKHGVRVGNVAYLNGAILPGTRVVVRHDPQDLGRVFLFCAADGDFLGEAVNPELSGLPPEAMVKAQRALQAETVAEAAKAIETVRRNLRKGPSLAERARTVWLRDQPNVEVFPRPTVEHSTADIAAALEAVTHHERAPVAQLSERAAELHAELLSAQTVAPVQPPAGATVTPIRKYETPELRFRRALALEGRLALDSHVEAEELLWLGGYQQGPEYRVRRKMLEEHGADAMSF